VQVRKHRNPPRRQDGREFRFFVCTITREPVVVKEKSIIYLTFELASVTTKT